MSVFEQIIGEVHGHSLTVDSELIASWVRDTWNEIIRFRTWSFLRRKYQIVIPERYTAGRCTLTPGSTTVVFTGATLTEAMIGRQFRRGAEDPIHDITSVDTAAGTAQIFPEWNATTTTVTNQSFVIFTAYIYVPDDFYGWLSVTDPPRRNRLRLHVDQETLDYWDQKRICGSYPACLSGVDWVRQYGGRVYPVLQVVGTGAKPIASGTYTGQADALYVVTVAIGGAVDTATFTWQIDSGTSLSGTGTTTSDPDGTTLPGGIGLRWPSGTYVSGNVFVIRVSSSSRPSLPRYEIYPHPTGAMVLPALYSTWIPDIESESFVLPRPIDIDIVKTGVLAKLARYSGTDDKRNPFAQIGRADFYETKFTGEGGVLHRAAIADDYMIETNVFEALPEAPLPWIASKFMPLQNEDRSGNYIII